MNYYPIINKKECFLKQIDDKTILYIKRLSNKTIALNQTAKYIMDLCDGYNNIENIITNVIDSFEVDDGEEDKVKMDTIKFLQIMDKYGVIAWKKMNNPFEEKYTCGNITIIKIGLSTLYRTRLKFLHSIRDAKEDKEGYYNKDMYVQGIYNDFLQCYYLEKDGKPSALIELQIGDIDRIWEVKRISYNNNFNLKKDFKTLLNKIHKDMIEITYKNNELKLGYVLNVTEEFVETGNQLGFNKKFVLEKEIDGKLYSMWITL